MNKDRFELGFLVQEQEGKRFFKFDLVAFTLRAFPGYSFSGMIVSYSIDTVMARISSIRSGKDFTIPHDFIDSSPSVDPIEQGTVVEVRVEDCFLLYRRA